MAKRFIKLYEQITSWEWFRYPNTLCLFIYLLLKANYKDLDYHGMKVKRGQLITSLPKISTDTGLSIQQTRTALSHLISTGEVTDESNHQYRLITIVKYDSYQSATDKSTDDQQTINRRSSRRSTDDLTPSIEYIEQIENIEKKEKGASRFTPPTKTQISDYCRENGIKIDEDRFFDYYESNGWMVGRNRMKDWKATVRNWAKREEENGNGGYRQHRGAAEKPVWQDYSDLKRRT